MKSINPGTILVTEGTSASTQRLAKQLLALWSVHFASADSVPQVLLRTHKYHQLPAITSDVFIHELLKLSLDLEVGYILPLHPDEKRVLHHSIQLFKEYGVEILSLCTNADGESYLCNAG